jgi:hypothetical protein
MIDIFWIAIDKVTPNGRNVGSWSTVWDIDRHWARQYFPE